MELTFYCLKPCADFTWCLRVWVFRVYNWGYVCVLECFVCLVIWKLGTGAQLHGICARNGPVNPNAGESESTSQHISWITFFVVVVVLQPSHYLASRRIYSEFGPDSEKVRFAVAISWHIQQATFYIYTICKAVVWWSVFCANRTCGLTWAIILHSPKQSKHVARIFAF